MKYLKIPTYDLKLKSNRTEKMVFDPIRGKFVAFTPEEFVRQNFIQHLIQYLGFPQSLISVEKEIMIHGLSKRYDIALYNPFGNVLALIECKAPKVGLNQGVLDQIINYSHNFEDVLLVITNGPHTLCTRKKSNTFIWESELPQYQDLIN